MDHTPGQGQFKEISLFKNYFGTVYKKNDLELDEIINRKILRSNTKAIYLDYLIEKSNSAGIFLASHDDDSREKVEWFKKRGIIISEFPVSLEAAKAAKENGIYVCVGAPNILRGKSQANNLSARDLISYGYADIICSDYSPMSIIHSIFTLERLGILSLHESVKMATLNPARAMKMDNNKGSIEIGKDADLLLVDINKDVPRILMTLVKGKIIHASNLHSFF